MNRRSFLRGAGGIAIGLPFLEAMQPRTAAAAATTPKRLVIMYSSNGTVMNNWKPSATGPGFPISTILEPLDTPNLRPRLTVLSGIDMASAHKIGGNGHSVGMTNMLTCRPFKEVVPTEFGQVGWGGGISIDQEIAKRIKADGQLPSIELGIQTRKQYTNFYGYMSYAEGGGSTGAVPSDDDPRSAFDRLFGNVPDGEVTNAELQHAIDQRKSVLDFVQDDFTRLNGMLGQADQARLDQHLTLLRELESRLKVGAVCNKPVEPGFSDADIYDVKRFPEIGQTQMDLLAMALSCDITRVGTLQFSSAQSGTVFETRIPDDWGTLVKYHHGLSHEAVGSSNTNPDPTQQNALSKLTKINTWFATQLAYFGEKLAALEDVDGTTVLDNTAVLWVSEVSEGPTHKFTDMPYVLLGSLGGALKTNQHLSFGNQRSHSDLFVTLGQAMGLSDFTTFGDPEFLNGPIEEMLA